MGHLLRPFHCTVLSTTTIILLRQVVPLHQFGETSNLSSTKFLLSHIEASPQPPTMKYIVSTETLNIPDDVSLKIRSRVVEVTGPRGKLVKDLSHIAVTFTIPKKQVVQIEIHHGSRKNVATLRTVKSIIQNLITGVTKGYKYKMRYVYAHFPINVNIEKNKEQDLYELEIRNFLGEKIVRHVTMKEGVTVEPSKGVKDQIELTGNSVENVSQSAADIQQACLVKNKDIRKFLDGLYVSERGTIAED